MRFTAPVGVQCWLEVTPESDFPIQNLPIAVGDVHDRYCLVSRIGDWIVDLERARSAGLLDPLSEEDLDPISPITIGAFEAVRSALCRLLSDPSQAAATRESGALVPVDESVRLDRPLIGQFVDFYAGIHHASNVGKMFRPDGEPLLPNYRHLPVGYNGRASSVVVSGTPIRRPNGQLKPIDGPPIFAQTRELDFELEMGFYTVAGPAMGRSIPIDETEDFILGFCLVNDWSARDVQRWEYQPLGPFLAKSFATSVSPWIVSPGALEPFRVPGPRQDPEPLPYLRTDRPSHLDIRLEVSLQTSAMTTPQVISQTNACELYWSFSQMLAHQSSNGTPIEAGDLYAGGTISGPEPGSYGSMLELTWRGSRPITMHETGEVRTFLEDGDRVVFHGYAQGDGYRIGFGELTGVVIAQ
jgi:fumarylacetoacetase